jgi:hypothetical protein
MSNLAVYNEVAGSNMPSRAKSAVLSFMERHTSGGTSPSFLQRYPQGQTALLLKRLHGSAHQSMLRQHGEAALFGALYAGAKNTVGLDVGAKKFPVDGIVAALALGAGAMLARRGSGLATECNNLAASSLTLLSFRKLDALMSGKLPATKSKVAGEDDLDPVVASAQGL